MVESMIRTKARSLAQIASAQRPTLHTVFLAYSRISEVCRPYLMNRGITVKAGRMLELGVFGCAR